MKANIDSDESATPLLVLSPAAYLWQHAAAIAASAHQGQKSPGTKMPYFAHPARVAMLISSVFGCHEPEVLAAAYLHDVLEKTSIDRAGLALLMGEEVTGWVEWLSKNGKGEKSKYWELLAESPWQARLIKMADALDHLNGPPQYQADRIKTARKALALASSPEPALQAAAEILRAAIDNLDPAAA
ncbi:HD domain-containing protein [Luteolibacter luteus]|uniref:HD domain-containing protein n=1 Tax=Luteolibacter luteus TaxID=2728835 RepID=A0A858RGB7_9BACT|nr:HD domain-containing protein [Luteolibacter luteus]QJE95755.1 HD domain-containing protein [Luteolibacter luteus]